MKNRSFIRGIWGGSTGAETGKMYTRLTKIDYDIKLAQINPYEPKIKVYIFGEDNYKRMTDLGFDTKLIDKRPVVWDMKTQQYRHKIEIWKAGLEESEDIVFLDWDCIPLCPIPSDFWDVLSNKSDNGKKINVQAAIYMYVRRQISWRTVDQRKLSASTFVYLRGKETVNGIIDAWEELGRPWREETPLTLYIEKINGGWKGKDDYKYKYEPEFHVLYNYYDSDFYKTRRPIFFHFGTHKIQAFLSGGNKEGIKKNLDAHYNIVSNVFKAMAQK